MCICPHILTPINSSEICVAPKSRVNRRRFNNECVPVHELVYGERWHLSHAETQQLGDITLHEVGSMDSDCGAAVQGCSDGAVRWSMAGPRVISPCGGGSVRQ